MGRREFLKKVAADIGTFAGLRFAAVEPSGELTTTWARIKAQS